MSPFLTPPTTTSYPFMADGLFLVKPNPTQPVAFTSSVKYKLSTLLLYDQYTLKLPPSNEAFLWKIFGAGVGATTMNKQSAKPD